MEHRKQSCLPLILWLNLQIHKMFKYFIRYCICLSRDEYVNEKLALGPNKLIIF